MGTIRITILVALVALVPASAAAGPPAATEQRRLILPEHRLLDLSPDGRFLAAIDEEADEPCLRVLEVATLRTVTCAGLEALGGGMRDRSAIWSPGSDRIVIQEANPASGRDTDIWILDLASDELRDVTNDGFAGDALSDAAAAHPDPILLDRNPAWHPDGQHLVATRTEIRGGVPGATRLVRIDLATGAAEPIDAGPASMLERGELHAGWTPDGSRLTWSVAGASEALDGLWVSDAGGGRPQRVTAADPVGETPVLLRPAPGDLAIVIHPRAASRLSEPALALIDLDTGLETPIVASGPDAGSAVAALPAVSPDGLTLVHVTRLDAEGGTATTRLDARPVDGGSATTLLADLPEILTGDPSRTATWASDGTILLPGPSTLALLVRVDGPVRAATQGPGWKARMETFVGAVPIREEPSSGSATLMTVGRARSLVVTGLPTGRPGRCWWPVEDEASGVGGWVRMEHGLVLSITGTVPDDGGACWWPVEDAAG